MFSYCENCNTMLSGRQKKYCCKHCGYIVNARKNREINSKTIINTLISEALSINHLKLNSSKQAYREAQKLIK